MVHVYFYETLLLFFVFLRETESDVLVHVGELGTYMLVRKGDGSTSSTMIFSFSSLTPPTSSSEHSWWMVWNFVPRQNQTSKVGIGRCTNSGRSKLWDWQVCYMYRPGRDSSEKVIRSYSGRNYVVTKNTGTFSPDWWLIDSRFIYLLACPVVGRVQNAGPTCSGDYECTLTTDYMCDYYSST